MLERTDGQETHMGHPGHEPVSIFSEGVPKCRIFTLMARNGEAITITHIARNPLRTTSELECVDCLCNILGNPLFLKCL
jgi:hypothetical protein